MPVYVDKLRDWGWKYGKSCHMIADTNEELHELAERIGMKREWFQKATSSPHYDLTEKRRIAAVLLGAIELEQGPFLALCTKWRKAAIKAVGEAALISEEEANKVRAHLYR